TVRVLEITGGSDFAETFPVEGNQIEPGTVLVVYEHNPGRLKISDCADDHKVAGGVSGAGGVGKGGRLGSNLTGETESTVALTGRVFCKAEAVSSRIQPGDLLTTSDIPGHAMKAVRQESSRGAILGKAMSSLADGSGLVL